MAEQNQNAADQGQQTQNQQQGDVQQNQAAFDYDKLAQLITGRTSAEKCSTL